MFVDMGESNPPQRYVVRASSRYPTFIYCWLEIRPVGIFTRAIYKSLFVECVGVEPNMQSRPESPLIQIRIVGAKESNLHAISIHRDTLPSQDINPIEFTPIFIYKVHQPR